MTTEAPTYTARPLTFLIDYLSPERGFCIDVQVGRDLFEAVSAFGKLRRISSIRVIRQIGA